MAVGRVESGTQSATTTHDLGSGGAGPGIFICQWNLDDMTNGEVVRCYVKSKVLTGDTTKEAWAGYFSGVDGGGSNPIVTSDPVVAISGITVQCGVEEIGANTVSVPWALDKINDYA